MVNFTLAAGCICIPINILKLCSQIPLKILEKQFGPFRSCFNDVLIRIRPRLMQGQLLTMTEARPLCVLYPVPGESWDSPVCQKGASTFPSPMKRQALLPLTLPGDSSLSFSQFPRMNACIRTRLTTSWEPPQIFRALPLFCSLSSHAQASERWPPSSPGLPALASQLFPGIQTENSPGSRLE